MNILTLSSKVECHCVLQLRILENKNSNNDQFLNGLCGICVLKNKLYYMCSVVSIQWLNNNVAGLFVWQ